MIAFTVPGAAPVTLADDSAAVMLAVLGYRPIAVGEVSADDFLGRALIGLMAEDVIRANPSDGFDPSRTLVRLQQFADLATVAKAASVPVRWTVASPAA